MQYPNTDVILERIGSSPILEVAETVGKRERYNFEANTSLWRAASQAVAQTCIIISDGQSAQIRSSLKKQKAK